jgi:hypothetical protein
MPNFTGTFFVNADGKVSLNHKVLTLDSAQMSRWEFMGKSENGKLGINMWVAGESFLIIEDSALEIAQPFFETWLLGLKS